MSNDIFYENKNPIVSILSQLETHDFLVEFLCQLQAHSAELKKIKSLGQFSPRKHLANHPKRIALGLQV